MVAMEINFHGFSCFTIYGKDATVVIDPFDPGSAGIKLPKLKGNIVLANEDFAFHHAVSQVTGEESGLNIFDWPGEYEASGVNVIAVPAHNRSKTEEEKGSKAESALLFSFEVDGFKMCHLSNLGHKLTNEMLDMLGDTDILFVPVGGKGQTLDSGKAHEVIEQIDPRIVIPMYYAEPGSKIPLGTLDDFLKEVGMKEARREKSLKFKSRSELPQEHTEYVVVTRE